MVYAQRKNAIEIETPMHTKCRVWGRKEMDLVNRKPASFTTIEMFFMDGLLIGPQPQTFAICDCRHSEIPKRIPATLFPTIWEGKRGLQS